MSDTTLENTLAGDFTNFLNNDYVFAILVILVFAYGQRAGPKLPQWLIDFFSQDIVRVLFLSLLLVVRFESRPTVALIIAFAFVYIFQHVYIESFREKFISASGKQVSRLRDQETVKDSLADDIAAKQAIMRKLYLYQQRKNNVVKGYVPVKH